jgi:hypothetical protein
MPGQGVAALLSALRHDLSITRPAFANSKLVQDIEREPTQETVGGSNASLGQIRHQ